MDQINDSAKIAIWIDLGVFALATVGFVIWLEVISKWKRYKNSFQDTKSSTALSCGLAVCFADLVISIAILLGHFIIKRGDGVYITLVNWAVWIVAFVFLAKICCEFLFLEFKWHTFISWVIALSITSILACVYIPFISRYLWFAVAGVLLLYGIKFLWHFRCREDFHAFAVLIFISIIWPTCFLLPMLLGSAGLQVITINGEIWWYSAGMWTGHLLLVYYINYNLFSVGPQMLKFINSHPKLCRKYTGPDVIQQYYEKINQMSETESVNTSKYELPQNNPNSKLRTTLKSSKNSQVKYNPFLSDD